MSDDRPTWRQLNREATCCRIQEPIQENELALYSAVLLRAPLIRTDKPGKSADGSATSRNCARVGATLRISISPRSAPFLIDGPAMKNEACISGCVGA